MANTDKYPDANPNHPQFGTDKVLVDKLVGVKNFLTSIV